jgi:TatD DNase family protein
MTGLFDTHCHFDDPVFDDDRDAAWQRARAAGVTSALIPAVAPDSWARTLACALPDERWCALGIHPQCLPELSGPSVDDGLASLEARVREHRASVVAIGECGFDGSIDLTLAPYERQRRVFAAHVEVACALDLPLVVHVFRAHGEALATLRTLKLPTRPGVIHSYSGGPDLAGDYLALGFHLAFGGAITRPNARKPVTAAREVPLERLLVETDAPDQTPTGVPDHVRRCEPAHVRVTARRLAHIRAMPEDALAERTAANARTLFALPDLHE